jgi:NhaP-type Na+/H+ and K+/H+ antiporter
LLPLKSERAVDNTYLIAAEWMALALLASLISIRIGVAVALLEIRMGVIGGNDAGPFWLPKLPARIEEAESL